MPDEVPARRDKNGTHKIKRRVDRRQIGDRNHLNIQDSTVNAQRPIRLGRKKGDWGQSRGSVTLPVCCFLVRGRRQSLQGGISRRGSQTG